MKKKKNGEPVVQFGDVQKLLRRFFVTTMRKERPSQLKSELKMKKWIRNLKRVVATKIRTNVSAWGKDFFLSGFKPSLKVLIAPSVSCVMRCIFAWQGMRMKGSLKTRMEQALFRIQREPSGYRASTLY